MILSMIIFGSIAWILVIILLFITIKEEELENDRNAIHISALYDGRIVKLIESGFIKGKPIVSQKDLDLISKRIESNGNKGVEREILNSLGELPIEIEDSDFLTICKKNNCVAIVADNEEEDKLQLHEIPCINIKNLDKIGKGRIYRGQTVRVTDMEYGYNKAIGFLDDGTMVEIKGKIPVDRPNSIDCRVVSIVEGSTYRKIWAEWEND